MTQPSPVQRFFGGLLMLVGALMAVLCGLCTVVFAAGGLLGSNGDMFAGGDIVVMALVIGGIPTVIGVGLFAGGLALWRGGRAKPTRVDVFSDPPP